MAKRIKLGIIYSYDENWIGGTYYYQNLIKSLNLLPDARKPDIVILSNHSDSFDSVKDLKYPFITCKTIKKKRSFYDKLRNKIIRTIFQKKARYTNKAYAGIDVLFHHFEAQIPESFKNNLCWIPDFQEIYLPHLFSEAYLNLRKQMQKKLLTHNRNILFSSHDACDDFKKLYPSATSNPHVIPFSVFHPDYSDINIGQLKDKYKLDQGPYFFAPNQFWQHKNQIVILKAIKKLKAHHDLGFQVVFSGREYDARNPAYFEDLKQYVSENGMENNIKFLGFIDRREQLCFMKHSMAVIQPSLFEGWSTVVEDAKAMNQHLIVSSLNVHKEQLGSRAYYFNPEDEKELMPHLLLFVGHKIDAPEFNYAENLHLFGERFMEVIGLIHKN